MTLDEAIQEFEFDCKIRHLSPKTIDNYKKQLRYFERFLANELSITSVEDVKPSHIKSFLSKMDDAGRKPQYINDLLKVYKTFFNYLESEGHIESSPAKRIRDIIRHLKEQKKAASNQKQQKTKSATRLFLEHHGTVSYLSE